MTRNTKTGFTIVELIITLVVVALLFATGYMYMSGYLPKQRLNTSANSLAALLQRIQSRAQTKGSQYGVAFVGDTDADEYYACGFKDENGDFMATHGGSNPCNVKKCDPVNCSEMTNEKWIKLKKEVRFFDCTGATVDINGGAVADSMGRIPDTITFDIKGEAYARTATSGILNNFEIMLRSCDVGVREVEVNSSGLIQVVRMGNAGNITSTSIPAGGQAGVTPCCDVCSTCPYL